LFPINSSNAVFINSHRATALAMLRYHGFDHTYSMKNHLSYGSDQRLSTPRRCWFFEEKDLGVLITSNLKPARQCQLSATLCKSKQSTRTHYTDTNLQTPESTDTAVGYKTLVRRPTPRVLHFSRGHLTTTRTTCFLKEFNTDLLV